MLTIFVITPVIIAVILFAFSTRDIIHKVAILFQTIFVAFAFSLFLNSRYAPITINVGDYTGLLGITLQVDNLAAIFSLLAAVIFLAVVIYISTERVSRLFWFLLFILESTLIGLFLTRDFFNAFVLVEVGTVVVTMLLMYDREHRNMYAGIKFIMVNIVVMQFYLFGLSYLYRLTGFLNMDAVADVVATMDQNALALPYALIMTGIASKCSLLPLLTWLPKVNSIPGSRSSIAAIVSGLHIKGGVYLFIRFQDVFGGMASEFFLVIGVVTAFASIALALAQTDARLILAYSTIAQVGLIIVGLSIGGGYSYMGSVLHVVNHAIFKAALFLGVGMVSYRYNTRDVTKMRGLFAESPPIAIAILMAVLGIIGAPLLGGFVSKYFLASGAGQSLAWIINLINLGTILVFVTKFLPIFLGGGSRVKSDIKPDRYKECTVLALGAICFGLGVFGVPAMRFMFGQDVGVDFMSYLQKILIFAASLGLSLLARKFVAARAQPFKALRAVDLSFSGICVSIGVFFAALLVFVGTV